MSTLERAIEIAREAHLGQVDRAGAEYIGHAMRVMEAGRTLEEKLVGCYTMWWRIRRSGRSNVWNRRGLRLR